MTNDLFEKAPIHQAYFKLALPVVCSMAVSLIYNMVDTFFIARTQNTQLVAGVSLCAPVFSLMIALGDIFGLGGSSVVSRLLGKKNDEDARHVSSYCFYAAMIFGLSMTAVMLIFRTQILHLLGADQSTYSFASDYYTCMAIGAPVVIVSLVPGNLMRTEGMAVASMIGTISGSVINMILDPIFIFSLNLGAAGAAIATVLGNLATDLILIWFIWKKSQKLSISWRDWKISVQKIKQIFAIGIPASLTNLMQSFSMALMNRYLMTYGANKVAAMGIAMKINMIILLIMVGFAFGAQPLIGYNYGAGKWQRLKAIIRFDLGVELIFSLTASILLALFAKPLITVFMNDTGIIASGTKILRCQLMAMPFAGVTMVFTTIFQSAGKALPATILSLSRQGVIFAVCIVLLATIIGYNGVILTQAAADMITTGIALILYRQSKITHPAD